MEISLEAKYQIKSRMKYFCILLMTITWAPLILCLIYPPFIIQAYFYNFFSIEPSILLQVIFCLLCSFFIFFCLKKKSLLTFTLLFANVIFFPCILSFYFVLYSVKYRLLRDIILYTILGLLFFPLTANQFYSSTVIVLLYLLLGNIIQTHSSLNSNSDIKFLSNKYTVIIEYLLKKASIDESSGSKLLDNIGMAFCKGIFRRAFPVYAKYIILYYTLLKWLITIFHTVFVYAIIFYSMSLLNPDSFNNKLTNFWDSIYYSLNTIASNSFGDIIPLSTTARIISIFELFTGLIFLVFSLYIALSHYLPKRLELIEQMLNDENKRMVDDIHMLFQPYTDVSNLDSVQSYEKMITLLKELKPHKAAELDILAKQSVQRILESENLEGNGKEVLKEIRQQEIGE